MLVIVADYGLVVAGWVLLDSVGLVSVCCAVLLGRFGCYAFNSVVMLDVCVRGFITCIGG